VDRTGPEAGRTCVACRERQARGALIRIVRGPGGEACFDTDGRLPGRGAWVCAEPACVDALAPAALARTLHAPAALPPPPERRAGIARAYERRTANLLQIARKSRSAVFGPTGVKSALESGRAGLLLLDGGLAPDAVSVWRARAATVPALSLPPAASLGDLAGRAPALVAALAPGGLAEATATAITRWQAFSNDSCHNQESCKRAPADGRGPGPRRKEAMAP